MGFISSLGNDNIPVLFLLIGAVMLGWLFFGDAIQAAI